MINSSKNVKLAQMAYEYARDVVQGPWPAGEAAIAQSTYFSFWYAFSVVDSPFPKGEAAIALASNWSYYYAHDVIRGRWIMGEAAIKRDAKFALDYFRFTKDQFSEIEQTFWLMSLDYDNSILLSDLRQVPTRL
jgi:hypothetical protein